MPADKIIVKIDDEDLLDIVEPYLQNRRDNIPVLRTALAQQDYDTLKNLGHKMKGSGGGYGLDRISEIGRSLEDAAKSSDQPGAERAVADLEDFLDRVQIA